MCIGIQSTAFTVHYLKIDEFGMTALLKSGICMFWIICCMVSMIVLTKTYMTSTSEILDNPPLPPKNNLRLYSSLLSVNTVFAAITFTITIFYR